jgi:hypothetical protein
MVDCDGAIFAILSNRATRNAESADKEGDIFAAADDDSEGGGDVGKAGGAGVIGVVDRKSRTTLLSTA